MASECVHHDRALAPSVESMGCKYIEFTWTVLFRTENFMSGGVRTFMTSQTMESVDWHDVASLSFEKAIPISLVIEILEMDRCHCM